MPTKKVVFKKGQEVVVTVDNEDYEATVVSFADPTVQVKFADGEKGKYNKKVVKDKKKWEKANVDSEDETEDLDDADLDVDDDLDSAIFDEDDEDSDDKNLADENLDDEGDEGDENIVAIEALKSLKEAVALRGKLGLTDVKITKSSDLNEVKEQLTEAYNSANEDDGNADEGKDDIVDEDIDEPEEKVSKTKKTKSSSDDSDKDSWFAEGDDEDSSFKDDTQRSTFGFSLKPDEEADITILTEQPLTYKQHNVKQNGKWGHRYTCITPMGEVCPICESGRRASVIKGFYIVDHRKFKSKDGKKTYVNQVRKMEMKPASYKVMKKLVAKYFKGEEEYSYKGLNLTVMRSDADKAPGTGDIFTVNKKVKILPEWLKHPLFEDEKVSIETLKKEVVPLDQKTLAQKIKFMQADVEKSSSDNDED